MEQVAASETKPSGRPALVAAGSLVATGVALAVAFFPMFFNQWASYDDEGVFTGGLRELLSHHGHLYSTIWADLYGPFYYLFMTTVFRVIRQQPSLENTRWILLVLTIASAALFGAAVWRIVKSVPCSIVAEVAAFLLLMPGAGFEPSHPGSLEVFLVAVVVFELSSYLARPRTAHLVGLGIATGALTMTKVNAGAFVAVGLVFAFVVGNLRMPRWVQIGVVALTALLPILVVSQKIEDNLATTLALLVIGSLVGLAVIASIDQLPLPRFSLVPVAAGAVAAVVCSLAFPLILGTSLSDEIDAVFIRPLSFADSFAILPTVGLDWLTFIVTIVGFGAAIAFRSFSPEKIRAQATWVHATLAALALWVLGLGILSDTVSHGIGYVTLRWLPAIVVLPALALCALSPEPIRLALRMLIALAVVESLVAYPVAGIQVAWGTVAMVVPCAIAVAVGIDHSRAWREAGWLTRTGATAVVCVALVAIVGTWPTATWKQYANNTALNLPGTGLVRLDPGLVSTLHDVTKELQTHCDSFYGVPNLESFHIFTGLPRLTGMVANQSPAALTADQQKQITAALQRKLHAHARTCILRSSVIPYPPPPGELGHLLKKFSTVVAKVGPYTISRHRFTHRRPTRVHP